MLAHLILGELADGKARGGELILVSDQRKSD